MSLLKRAARRIIDATPFEVQRRPTGPVLGLPPPTLQTVSLALAYFEKVCPGSTLVQVGAFDGVNGDDAIRGLLQRGGLNAVLVEPMEASFATLQGLYADVPNVRTVRAAVAASDGDVVIYKARDDGRWAGSAWAPQWTSLNRDHLLKHGVAEHEIEECAVPAVTLATLVRQQGLPRIDFLMIDTEGFDAEVVDMALELDPLPECIYYEHMHLTPKRQARLAARLAESGYEFAHDRANTLAVHERFRSRWR